MRAFKKGSGSKQKKVFFLIVLLLVFLTTLAILKKSFVDSYLKILIEKTVSVQIKSKVSIDKIDISIIKPSIHAKGVIVTDIDRGKSTLIAEDIKVFLSPMPGLFGKILIPRVEINDAVIATTPLEIERFGLLKNSSLGSKSGQILSFEVQKIKLKNIEIRILDKDSKARVKFSEISGDFSPKRGGIDFNGIAGFSNKAKTFEVGEIKGKIKFGGNRIEIADLVLRNKKDFSLNLKGETYPNLKIKGSFNASLQSVSSHFESSIPFKGAVEIPFSVEGTLKNPSFNGEIKSQKLEIGRIVSTKLQVVFSGTKSNLKIKSGILRLRESELSLSGDLKFNKISDSNIRFSFSEIDLNMILKDLTDLDRFPQGILSGSMELSFNDLKNLSFKSFIKGDLRSFSYEIPAKSSKSLSSLSIKFNDSTHLSASIVYEHGKPLKIESISFSGKEIQASARGELSKQKGNLEYDIKSERFDFLYYGERVSRGKLGLVGSLFYEKEKYFGDGSFRITEFGVGGGNLGSLGGNFRVDNDDLEITKFDIFDGKSRLSASLKLNLMEPVKLSLFANLSKFEVGNYLKLLFSENKILSNISCGLTGYAKLSGQMNELSGSLSFKADKVSLYQKEIGDLDILSDFDKGKIDIKKLSFKRGDEEILRGLGFYNLSGDSKVNLSGKNINIDTIDFLKVKRFFGESSLDFSFNYEKQSDKSKAYGNVRLNSSLKRDIGSNILNFDFNTDLKNLFINGNYKKEEIAYKMNLGLSGMLHAEISMESKEFNFIPFLSNFMTLNVDKIKGKAGMKAELAGNVKGENGWEGWINISDFSLGKEDIDLRNKEAIRVSLKNGRYKIEPFSIYGSGVDLLIEGNGAVNGENNISLRGYGNLNIMTIFFEEFTRGDGRIDLEANLLGSGKDIQVLGKGKLNNALLVIRDFPNVIQGINSDLTFSHRKILFDNLNGEIGGGKFSGMGRMEIGDFDGGLYFDAEAELKNVKSLFPLDFPGEVSGTIMFKGPYFVPTLSGDLVIHNLKYSQSWDWRSKVISFGGRSFGSRANYKPEVYLNVHLTAEEGAIEVKNNVADAKFSGDLRIVGDDKNIGLLGLVKLNNGKVSFLENDFELTDGTIKFTDNRNVLALFDISGRTTVKNVEIFLNLRGSSEKPELILESRPPKSETDIVTLLTLGVETSGLSSGGGAQSSLSQSVVASVLSGPIQHNIEKTFRKTRIIDTFQIYPSFSDETRNTELRVGIGKKIPYDLSVQYSTDVNNIGQNQEVKLNKALTDNFSLQGILKEKIDQSVDLGLDFEFKIDF